MRLNFFLNLVFLSIVISAIALIFPECAMAQTPPGDAPAWITSVINFLSGIPYVGPVIVFILKWSAILSAITTAVSSAVIAVLKVPEVIALWTGSAKWLERIQWFKNKVLPWLQYLSQFNVQKKKK